jgi:hypothetical protein
MSKLVLSEGQVTADSPISVQLIKNHPRSPISCCDHMAQPCHRVQPSKARRGDQQRDPHSRQRKH